MYQHILIATDGSELASHGLDRGLALAKALGAKVTVVRVAELWNSVMTFPDAAWIGDPTVIQQYEEAEEQLGKNILDLAAKAAAAMGVTAETLHLKGMGPATGILKAAKDKGCDLIVMTSHGRRGLNRLLLGSQTAEVLGRSELPVLVIR